MTATPSGRTSIQSAPTGSTRPRSRGPWKSPPPGTAPLLWPWGSTPTSIAGPTLPVRVNRNSDQGGTAGPAVPGSVVTKALFPSVKVVNLVRAEKRTDEAGDKQAARDIGLERWLGGAHAVHAAGHRVESASGTTATPSRSPTIRSPGATQTWPRTTGSPIEPGPERAEEPGVTPPANTGSPVAMMPAVSRARPSVTMAATWQLRAIPANRSPTTAVPVNPSHAATTTSQIGRAHV